MPKTLRHVVLASLAALALGGAPILAASHLWVVNEVQSNADGTIQFVELWSPSPNETQIANKSTSSDSAVTPVFPANLPAGSTANKHLLIATSGFAAMPGAPTPDLIMQDGFLDTAGDTIQWWIYVNSILSYGPGELPTDGVQSLERDGTTGPATPTNFSGGGFAPPEVSDLTVAKFDLFPDGSRLSVAWDETACMGAVGYHLVYGFGSGLPSSPSGGYVIEPAAATQCNIAGSPKTWSGIPDPASDATRFLWFLVLADDGTDEGSWGADSFGSERTGPMIGGASGQCMFFTKDVSNTCP